MICVYSNKRVYMHTHWFLLSSFTRGLFPCLVKTCHPLMFLSPCLLRRLNVFQFPLSVDLFLPSRPPTRPFTSFAPFFPAQVWSTGQSVTCSLGKEASWLRFVFLLRCGLVQSAHRLTATAPPVVSGRVSKHRQACACCVRGNKPKGVATRGRGEGL